MIAERSIEKYENCLSELVLTSVVPVLFSREPNHHQAVIEQNRKNFTMN